MIKKRRKVFEILDIRTVFGVTAIKPAQLQANRVFQLFSLI